VYRLGYLQEELKVQSAEEKSSAGRLFVPSLVVAFFSTWIIESLTGVFLVDVATTFFGSPNPAAIATTGQLVTISSVVSVVFALLLGLLSVRYSHKSLLLLGSFSVTLGILGCFFAQDFLSMQFFFPIEGIGTAAIGAMAFALVGDFLVISKRPRAIGWILAGGSLSTIVGSLVISLFFSGAAGWRSYLLWFALPISLLSLAAGYFGVPSAPQKPRIIGKEAYLSSLKQVFLKKSAAACLIGVMFRQAGFVWAAVYSATFFRTQFGLSLSSVALIGLVGGALFASANIVGGHLVHRVGRKRQLVATLAISSPVLMLVAFVPNLWVVLILRWVGGFIYGMSFPANTSLLLEQAPKDRGTMMSMTTIFVTFGMGLGTALGGASLILSGWTGLILAFAAMQLIAAAVFFFLTKDPCRM
jgi:DHA1 family inner membrane transport protein